MSLRRDPTRALQLGFLALLAICLAQVGWWIADHVLNTREVERQFEELYAAEAAVLSATRAGAPGATGGAGAAIIEAHLPHLDVDAASGLTEVRPEALEVLHEIGARRTNRYLWEGGFFLLVLLGGMLVLTRTIRHDVELRRRQQNFLAAVSHEFKSPLASMRLAAETLMLRATEPDSQRLGRRILDDGERLLRMVDNLLDTTRLEEGRHPHAPEELVLAPLVHTIVHELGERARVESVTLVSEVPADLRLEADPEAVSSILRNLLDNAIKACHGREGAQVRVTARADHGQLTLEVADNGIGFPPEDAAMIFEKFYRVGDELKRATPGTGLGLYIVKRLAELSRGSIVAHSAGPGRGATFTLRWPLRRST